MVVRHGDRSSDPRENRLENIRRLNARLIHDAVAHAVIEYHPAILDVIFEVDVAGPSSRRLSQPGQRQVVCGHETDCARLEQRPYHRLGTDSSIVPINLPLEGNPHPGEATITDQQAADLEAGRWYVVLKTEKFPAGEVRGPVMMAR